VALGLLHVADVHVGAPAGALPPEVAHALARERLAALAAAVAEARRRRAAALLVAGDLLEGRLAVREHAAAVAGCLRSPDLPVVIVPGNHDPATDDSYYRRYPWPDNVTVVPDEAWAAVALGELVVHALGWTLGAMPELPAIPRDGRAHVLLLHADLEPPGGRSPYRPLAAAAIAGCGAAYVALGHVHAGGRLAGPAGRVLAAYPGSLTPLGFGEEGTHGALWVEVEPDRPGALRAELLSLAPRAFRTVDVFCDEAWGPAELAAACRRALPAAAAGRDLVRIRLRGPTPATGIDPADLAGLGYYVAVEDHTEPALDLAALVAEQPHGLLARFVQTLQARLAAAPANQAAAAGGDDPDPEPAPPPTAEADVVALALRYGVLALLGRRLVEP
jgi:DNA repair exonuclease SbcCD nuclease subunit